MTVRRIVANLPAEDPAETARFWREVFGLDPLMDAGFIVTLGATAPGADAHGPEPAAPPQLSLAREGGSGTPLPAVSVEVDDLDGCLARARALGAPIEYGPVTEPWEVRRFYLRDPSGNLVNVLTHR